eukprot:6555088-Ditylum_brightwellii.AAC.1
MVREGEDHPRPCLPIPWHANGMEGQNAFILHLGKTKPYNKENLLCDRPQSILGKQFYPANNPEIPKETSTTILTESLDFKNCRAIATANLRSTTVAHLK